MAPKATRRTFGALEARKNKDTGRVTSWRARYVGPDLERHHDVFGEHLLRSTVATFVARRMSPAEASVLLGHKVDTGVTPRHYIERLRLAPDTSAVLQAMIEIGEEEARKKAPAGEERRESVAVRSRAAVPSVPVDDPDDSGW